MGEFKPLIRPQHHERGQFSADAAKNLWMLLPAAP